MVLPCLQDATLLEDNLTHRSSTSLPPLLQRLSHRAPESLDYLGVLNVLPISRGKDIVPIEDDKGKGKKAEGELKELKASLSDTKPVGDLVQLAKTVDQVIFTLTV